MIGHNYTQYEWDQTLKLYFVIISMRLTGGAIKFLDQERFIEENTDYIHAEILALLESFNGSYIRLMKSEDLLYQQIREILKSIMANSGYRDEECAKKINTLSKWLTSL